MYQVLILDPLADEGLAVLERTPGMTVHVATKLTPAELRAELARSDGAILRSGAQLTAETLEGQTRLRAIVRAGVGVDNIDVAAATRQGIVVMNTPAGNTVSTAEHTLALLLALSRNLAAAAENLHQGRWERARFMGTQLAGKVLGIIGLGRVGMAVAKRALGLDMKVVGYDPFLSAERAAEKGVESVSSLDDLWPRCDYITVHTPLTEETRGLVGAKQMARMRRGVRLINCARGGIIDEGALLEGLNSGQVAGAALDAFEQEPPDPGHPLLKHPNVLATPHLGASTAEAQASVAVEAAQLMVDYLATGAVRYAVNASAIDLKELADLRLYLDLGRRLGLLHAQMDRGNIRRVQLTYRGEVAQKNTRLITASFAAGLLETALVEQVNLVNAEWLARERGIELVEQVSSEAGDFSTLVRAEVTTDQKQYVAAGTLFGNQFLRLVQLGPFHLDGFIDGVLLIFSHHDAPGLIGFIGTIFGKHQVNIAQMTVGRELREPGGEAIGVLNLDSEPPREALAELEAHDQVYSISVVKLPAAGEAPPWLA
jgi:D-3-phosphoglycerate dehydrogenase